MAWILTKTLVTAALIVLISELAKRSDKLGAFVAAMPWVTVLTLCWLVVEKQPDSKVTNHAWYTLWYVLPTLPMFAAFPWMHRQWGFVGALAGSAVLTAVCTAALAWVLKRWDIQLF